MDSADGFLFFLQPTKGNAFQSNRKIQEIYRLFALNVIFELKITTEWESIGWNDMNGNSWIKSMIQLKNRFFLIKIYCKARTWIRIKMQ